MIHRKQTFEVLNVKCEGCAARLKKQLFEEFGEVEVDLGKEPRQITLEIADEQIDVLRGALKQMGYPMVSEEMGFLEESSMKAKSYVSCAIGKINQ
ncbi:MAG: heavy metal-associated domain-containing protein [Sulfurimonas sp.]